MKAFQNQKSFFFIYEIFVLIFFINANFFIIYYPYFFLLNGPSVQTSVDVSTYLINIIPALSPKNSLKLQRGLYLHIQEGIVFTYTRGDCIYIYNRGLYLHIQQRIVFTYTAVNVQIQVYDFFNREQLDQGYLITLKKS